MNWLLVAPIGGVIGLALAPLVAWLNARRVASGKVSTTAAETLWDEAEKMRHEYRAEAERLRAEVLGLRAEVASLQAVIHGLRAEVHSLMAEALQCVATLAACREEANQLRVQLSRTVPDGGTLQ